MRNSLSALIICTQVLLSWTNAFCEDIDADMLEFNSSSEALYYGLANSDRLNYQRLQAVENIGLKKMSMRVLLPSVSVSYSENDSVNIMMPDSRSKSFQVSLSQQVYNGGKTKLEYDMNLMSAQYEYQEFLLSTRSFQSDIIKQYYELLMQKKVLEIHTSLCDAASAQLRILKKEYELGVTLETDYLEYCISYTQLEYEKSKYVRDLKKQEDAFKKSLGIGSERRIRISDEFADRKEYVLLKDKREDIFNKVKSMSVALQKTDLALNYKNKLMKYENRQNLPSVTLQSSMSFSGISYPLTEPDFSFRCTVALRNGLFPVSVTSGLNTDQKKVTGVSNSIEAQVLESSTYFVEKRISKISVLLDQLGKEEEVAKLEDTVTSAIDDHDDTVSNIDMKKSMIGLMVRKLAIDKVKLEKGELKQIDYLNQLIALSKEKVALMTLQLQIETSERALEILTMLPFGGLMNED